MALLTLFAIPGVTMSSWVTRTPDIRDMLGASTAEMGIVLLGLSAGTLLGVSLAGHCVARFSARAATTVGLATIIMSLPTMGWGAAWGQGAVVALGLFLLGIGLALSDVALNIDGARYERETGASILPAIHGCYSLGTVLGALLGTACNYAEVPVPAQFLGVATLSALFGCIKIRHVSGAAKVTADAADASGARRGWIDSRLLVIGVIAFAAALAEGAAMDWLPLVMVDGHGLNAAWGALVFVGFALTMAACRLSSSFAVARIGPSRVVRLCGLVGVVGVGAVIAVDNQIVAGTSVVLWGLGVALTFPLCISAVVVDSGTDSAARVSFILVLGYTAFLAGPPLLGFIGQRAGLRGAMVVPLALLALTAILASALKRDEAPACKGAEALVPTA